MMKRISAVVLGLCVVALAGAQLAPAASAQAPATGMTTLLDGTNWNQFTPIGNAAWRVVDGAVQSDKGAGFLVSKQSYGDFEMRAEFWVSPDANSGIFIRCQNPTEIAATNCYEVNAYDQRPDPIYRTGGIVDVAKPMVQMNAGNRWNTFEISARGPRLIVRLNGTLMADVEDKKFARGPFALQAGIGTVKFRNVQIRPL